MKIRDDFHQLIDNIEDEQVLQHYSELIRKRNEDEDGNIWNDLSEAKKKDLLVAYDESFNKNNLLSHEQVKLQHEKWLKP